MKKTITAWEVKKGQTILVKSPKTGSNVELFVTWVKRYQSDSTISIWGLQGTMRLGASQAVILTSDEGEQ